MRISEKKKYYTITTMERDRSGKPTVKTMEMRCRAALSEYKAQVSHNNFGLFRRTVRNQVKYKRYYYSFASLARLIGICELKIIDKKKYHTIIS